MIFKLILVSMFGLSYGQQGGESSCFVNGECISSTRVGGDFAPNEKECLLLCKNTKGKVTENSKKKINLLDIFDFANRLQLVYLFSHRKLLRTLSRLSCIKWRELPRWDSKIGHQPVTGINWYFALRLCERRTRLWDSRPCMLCQGWVLWGCSGHRYFS